jgi:poly-gamma-glutamate biosynthesis protein PgsC/CapC
MHDYLFTTEVVRFAFMLGVAVSMILYERRHLTTGSIVVPGYIATFLATPFTIVATFLNAFVSYWMVNKVLRRWFLLYGRTKFTVLVTISILIQTLMLKFSPIGSWLWESDFKLLVGVGYVVPALIAHDMGRQGIKKTIRSVSLAGLIVALPIGLALLVRMPGINDLAPLRGGSDIAIEAAWIPIAVLLSAAAAWGVARHHGLRSGGFMGAAFIALLLADPWQVVMVASVAAVTYLLVTRLLMNSMILFGRRKFSAMLLLSASMSWALLWVGREIFAVGVQSHMDLGSLALTPLIVPGLLANDAQRTSPVRVIGGASLATTFVLSATWTIQSTVEHRYLDLGWRITAVLSGGLIFGKPLYLRLRARATRAVAAVPELAAAAAGTVPTLTPMEPNFGAGYQGWASLHREAADAAERWLASILGESPALAVVAAPNPAPPRRSAAEHNAETRTLDKVREAAIRALDSQTRRGRAAPPLPVRPKPLPVRRRSVPPTRRGEFDDVTVQIAGSAGPHPLSTSSRDGRYVSLHPPHSPVVLDPDCAAPEALPRPRPQAPPHHVFPG